MTQDLVFQLFLVTFYVGWPDLLHITQVLPLNLGAGEFPQTLNRKHDNLELQMAWNHQSNASVNDVKVTCLGRW